jgi:hypothetical protein
MAEKVLVEIEIDDSGTVKSLNNLDKQVDAVGESADKAAKSTTGLGKAFGGVGVAVKGVGAALKSAGIGIIIGLVSKFTEVLLQNQTVVDGLNKAFNTLSIVFQQFTKPLFEFAEALSSNNEQFDALLTIGKNLLTIVLAPLRVGFLEIEAAILVAQLAWEQSFFGDGDQDRIKELEEGLKGVQTELLEIGKSVIDAGSSIADNFTEAISEAGDIFTNAKDAIVDGFNDIDVAAAISGAAAIENAKKRAEFLELEQQRLIERFDLEAELQRQIRDDVSRTIEERIEANIRLGEILNEQAEMEAANVERRISAIQLQNNLLGETQERSLEIFQLQTELEEINARVAGFRSEQLTNENALLEEQKQIVQSRVDTELEVLEIQQTAINDLIESETARIEAQMALERQLNDARLAAIDERLMAETESTLAYQEILNERATVEANYQANRLKQEQNLAKAEIKIEETVANAKIDITRNAISAAAAFAEEGSDLAKGLAVAQTTIDTYKGATAAYAALAGVGPIGPALGAAAAAVVVASGLANVKKILSVKTDGSISGGGASSSTSAGPAPPSVGQSIGLVNPNAGAQNIGDQIQQGFEGGNMRAYVVGSDVSGQQQVDREIAQNGTFG